MTKNQKNKKKQPKEKDKFQWWTGHTIEKIIDISFPPFECHLKKFPEKIPTHTHKEHFFFVHFVIWQIIKQVLLVQRSIQPFALNEKGSLIS